MFLTQRLNKRFVPFSYNAREDSLLQRCCPSPLQLRPRRDHIYTAVVIVILVIYGFRGVETSKIQEKRHTLEVVARPGSSDVVRLQLCGLPTICPVSFTRIWFHSITLLTAYCCHSYYDLLSTDINSSFPTVQILGFASLPSCLIQALHFHIPSHFFYNLKWGLSTIN